MCFNAPRARYIGGMPARASHFPGLSLFVLAFAACVPGRCRYRRKLPPLPARIRWSLTASAKARRRSTAHGSSTWETTPRGPRPASTTPIGSSSPPTSPGARRAIPVTPALPGIAGPSASRQRPAPEPDFALLIPSIDDAYELYWNGVKVGHLGTLPPHPVLYEGVPAQTYGLGPIRSGVLAVRVWKFALASNDPDNLGGFEGMPLIG